MVERAGRVETSCHLQVVLWNRCWIFSFWWANMCHEIRLLDLWWVPGQEKVLHFIAQGWYPSTFEGWFAAPSFFVFFILSPLNAFDLNGLVMFERASQDFLFAEIHKFLNNAFIVSHLKKNSLQLGAKIRYYYRESTLRRWCLERLQ